MSMELPDYLHKYAAENLAVEGRGASIGALWAVKLRLVPVRDGDMWMVLYGDNIQTGIAAFGKSPEAAMFAFDEEMQRKL